MSKRIPAPGAAFSRHAFGLKIWPEAIVVRLEAHDAAERSGGDEFADRLKIAVVAAILIHGEKPSGLFGEVYELDGFGVRSGEWLVDDDVVSGGERGARERRMCFVRSRNHDELNIRQREKSRRACARFSLRDTPRQLRRLCAEESRRDAARSARNHLSVECAPGETESDEADVDHDERL